jgi:hypothetical protein
MPDQPGAHPDRQLVLVKHDQRWVFRYRPGDEAGVMRTLAETARDPGCVFDWFDAAVLSHQMGHRLGAQVDKFTKQ